MAEIVGGPFFEDLFVGQVMDAAPACTLTDGLSSAHAAIVGDRMRLSLDAELCRRVTGRRTANPALVWDVAIGQSTLFTQRVIANLFYRGFVFSHFPQIGDTLYTATEIVALRQNSRREGRPATGLGVMRIRTVDQNGREVLDFLRCAMFPLRDPAGMTPHAANLAEVTPAPRTKPLTDAIADWRLDHFRSVTKGKHFADLKEGTIWEVAGGDLVSSAPELARLTFNVAIVHHDSAQSGSRLVYGGHTIGLATLQITRALPNLVTIIAWHSCDHLAPVREGDTLHSTVELEKVEPIASGGGLVHLRSRVSADRSGGSEQVLDWRLVGVMA